MLSCKGQPCQGTESPSLRPAQPAPCTLPKESLGFKNFQKAKETKKLTTRKKSGLRTNEVFFKNIPQALLLSDYNNCTAKAISAVRKCNTGVQGVFHLGEWLQLAFATCQPSEGSPGCSPGKQALAERFWGRSCKLRSLKITAFSAPARDAEGTASLHVRTLPFSAELGHCRFFECHRKISPNHAFCSVITSFGLTSNLYTNDKSSTQVSDGESFAINSL